MKRNILLLVFAVLAAVPALANTNLWFNIVPRTRYLLTYHWSSTNFPDVASRPLGQWNVCGERYPDSPVQVLEFFVTNNVKETSTRDWRFQALLPGASGEWRYEFYAPDNRRSMSLSVADVPKENKYVTLSNVTLTAVTSAPTLNVNPDFALGLYNYCGIAGVNEKDEVVMLENPQGGYSFHSCGGFQTTATPIEAGKRYRIEYTGWGSTSKSYIDPSMTFSGKDMQPDAVKTVSLPRVTADAQDPHRAMTKTFDFMAPEGAEWVRFSFYYATLDSIRLTSLERAPSMVFFR